MQLTPATNYLTIWSSYSSAAMLTGFQLAASLGFNTVRIFLPAISGCFDFPSPTTPELDNLTDACNQAAAAGVRLHITLFDHFGPASGNTPGGYGQIAASQTWASAVITAIQASSLRFNVSPNLSTVFLELQNETYWGTPNTYPGTFDSGWPGYPTIPSGDTDGQVAVVWAQQMIPYLRTQSGGTVCTSTYELSWLSIEVDNLSGNQIPDWYEFHNYPSFSPSSILSSLSTAQANVSPAALYIGETGYPDLTSGPIAEAQWYQWQRYYCQQLGLPEPAPWQLYEGTLGEAQGFGLFDRSNNPKPAAKFYQKYPVGSYVPPVGSNRYFHISNTRSRLAGPAY